MGPMSVYERHTLSNGLRVLTAPLDHAQSVACYVMLAAGSRYENAQNRGIAHFAEHMFFKGTERRPTARDIAMEVDSIGGEFNAFTSKEYTGYYIRCAGEQRDQALDVLVDMLRNSKFDAEELEREKGVILEEMNMYFDTPRDYVGSVYEELLFGDEPARLGDARHEARRSRRRRARRSSTTSTSGTRRRAWSSARRHGRRRPAADARRSCSATWRRRPGAPAPAEVERTPEPRVRVHRKDADQANVCARRSRATRSTTPTATRCSCSAPCSAPGCRRASSSRCASAAASPTTSSAYNNSYTDAGTLYAQAGVDLKRADEAVGVIADEFKQLADEPVPAGELEKARALAKGRFVLQTESPNGLILFGLRREVLEGAAAEPEEILAGLDAVTVEDVQRVAQDVIGGAGFALRA